MNSATNKTTTNDTLSISQLNNLARDLLESHFPMVWVEGEISNLVRPTSGHLYLSLKDSQAQIRAAMFKGRNQKLGFSPKDGMQVLVRAKLSLYPARGDYQLIIDQMEEAGDGALRRAFEQLKQKLAAEGLFAEAYKQPLPALPKQIGVITSPTGAAIRDILTVLKRRFPAIPVRLYPVSVQGTNAAPEIVAAIEKSNAHGLCDVLIIGRGGGSLEDLWAFNEEIVARAIAASNIPIVSAVGHETDFTIADLVADTRAPTPSAAAELISPDQLEMLDMLKSFEQLFNFHLNALLTQAKHKLQTLQKRTRHPGQRLRDLSQRLDEMESRIKNSQQHFLKHKKAELNAISAELKLQTPSHKIAQLSAENSALYQRLRLAMMQHLQQLSQQLQLSAQQLNAVSPLATLERGYAIVSNKQGNIVKQSTELKPGDVVNTRLHAGKFTAAVVAVSNDTQSET